MRTFSLKKQAVPPRPILVRRQKSLIAMKPANSSPAKPAEDLFGQTVLVTRAADQSTDLVRRIEAVGGRAVVQPVIEILPVADFGGLEASIGRLKEFGLLVFTSRNGVRFFKDRLDLVGVGLPKELEIAAIGTSTAELAAELWLVEPAVPASSNSPSLADCLIERFHDRKMLLVRGDRGSDVLDRRLREFGVEFESVVAYRSVDVVEAEPAVVAMLEGGQIDWVTATSSAIGRSAVRLFGGWLAGDSSVEKKSAGKPQAKLVSISPTTTTAIESVGGKVAAEATEYSLDGLVAAMKTTSLESPAG